MGLIRLVCIKKLETNVEGEMVTVEPGSYWLMNEPVMWQSEFILWNEDFPEEQIVLSEYVLRLCFKWTQLRF